MPFIKPMFASPLPESWKPNPREWVVEEKFDGHRIVAQVTGRTVQAWSRYGRERILPKHVREALHSLPDGVWDGELRIPGSRSYGVVVLEDADKLVYTVFDVLEIAGRAATHLSYDDRRTLLNETWKRAGSVFGREIADSCRIDTRERVDELAEQVWNRDGEGLIIKRRAARYEPGKRAKHWLKVKKLRTAVLTVVEYVEGLMGPCATVRLRDDEGYETTVKTLNFAELARLEADPGAYIGRQLRIEYQERTPDHGYRHPRWDRWENE